MMRCIVLAGWLGVVVVAEPYNFAAQAVLGKPLIIYGAPTTEEGCVSPRPLPPVLSSRAHDPLVEWIGAHNNFP